jgi:indolepyruvate decarboxylase
MPNPTVVEYVVQRLADLGIGHAFGLPGDYVFPFDDAIEDSDRVAWIGSSNELCAAYAANGYARINGAAILATTYVVGESSALNGVLASKAERLPVFHLVGTPSTRLARNRLPLHHTFGNGEFSQFRIPNEIASCVSTALTPENTIAEMERVISVALSHRQPAYITVAQDYALMPVVGELIRGVALTEAATFTSNPGELDAAVAAIIARLAQARAPVVLPSFMITRWKLEKEVEALLAATGVPFATTGMDKGVLPESHPLFLGMYRGEASTGEARRRVEDADLVLDLGGVIFTELATAGFSGHVPTERIITIAPDHVTLGIAAEAGGPGPASYSPVHIKDVLDALTKAAPRFETPSFEAPTPTSGSGEPDQRVTYASLTGAVQQFVEPGDILMGDSGLSSRAANEILLPGGTVFLHQNLWGSIGWGTPAAFGAALADPSRRVILVQGDGSHQLTAGEVGAMGRYGVNPIILIVNNGIFGVEEFTMGNDDMDQIKSYDRLAPWTYHRIPEVMGCRDWLCQAVSSNAELVAALRAARDHSGGAYIEILLDTQMTPALPRAVHERLYQVQPPAE